MKLTSLFVFDPGFNSGISGAGGNSEEYSYNVDSFHFSKDCVKPLSGHSQLARTTTRTFSEIRVLKQTSKLAKAGCPIVSLKSAYSNLGNPGWAQLIRKRTLLQMCSFARRAGLEYLNRNHAKHGPKCKPPFRVVAYLVDESIRKDGLKDELRERH